MKRAIASSILVAAAAGLLAPPARATSAGTTQRASVPVSGVDSAPGRSSFNPAVSFDGRFVAFDSDSPALIEHDRNDHADVFRFDRRSGTVERVSVSSGGSEGNAGSYDPAMSADGRFVAFASSASNLIPGDRNNTFDVFVRDLARGSTRLASVDPTGKAFTSGSFDPA
ncbi:MAG TPA: hypothetical protein VM841_13490, partial [Actinomycetota bacterium]|nr:hypothetical protein [Actinomycetota bacterium]